MYGRSDLSLSKKYEEKIRSDDKCNGYAAEEERHHNINFKFYELMYVIGYVKPVSLYQEGSLETQ